MKRFYSTAIAALLLLSAPFFPLHAEEESEETSYGPPVIKIPFKPCKEDTSTPMTEMRCSLTFKVQEVSARQNRLGDFGLGMIFNCLDIKGEGYQASICEFGIRDKLKQADGAMRAQAQRHEYTRDILEACRNVALIAKETGSNFSIQAAPHSKSIHYDKVIQSFEAKKADLFFYHSDTEFSMVQCMVQ